MDKRQRILHELQMAVDTGCEVRIECEFVRLAYIAGSFDSPEIMAMKTDSKWQMLSAEVVPQSL